MTKTIRDILSTDNLNIKGRIQISNGDSPWTVTVKVSSVIFSLDMKSITVFILALQNYEMQSSVIMSLVKIGKSTI